MDFIEAGGYFINVAWITEVVFVTPTMARITQAPPVTEGGSWDKNPPIIQPFIEVTDPVEVEGLRRYITRNSQSMKEWGERDTTKKPRSLSRF
jgi:hypothetical protein